MFNSTILDVVVGLIFVFLSVSLAASALTETLASVLKLRHRTLLSGIQALLNDHSTNGLVKDLYNHALVNPLSSGDVKEQAVWRTWTTKPAYIEASNFAAAFVSTLETRAAPGQAAARNPAGGNAVPQADQGGGAGAVPAKSLAQIVGEIPDPQLKQAMQELLAAAANDRDRFVTEVARWFDDAMDRVGGWYKRYTQVIGFLVAFGVAAILNADAIRIGQTLWQRPTLVSELSIDAMAPSDGTPASAGQSQATTAQAAVAQLAKADLFGYPKTGPASPNGPASMVLGWLIVAGASLFGASFWFDLLQKIGQVAGVGRSDDDAKKRAGKVAT